LSLAFPALAQDGAGDAPAKGAKGEPAPQEQQAPPPAPSGCPFRDGKLELIA
jgi:hypothetical protein